MAERYRYWSIEGGLVSLSSIHILEVLSYMFRPNL